MIDEQIEQLANDDLQYQTQAIQAILSYGKTAVPALCQALYHANKRIRMKVIYMLGQIHDESSLSALIALTSDPDVQIRFNTIHAIGKYNNRQSINILKKVLFEEKDLSIQKAAIYWLVQSGEEKTFHEVMAFALAQPDLQLEAAWTITQSGQNSPVLVDLLLANLETCSASAFPHLMSALGKLGNPIAFVTIAKYLTSQNSYHRALAAQTLGILGDTRAILLLTELLIDEEIAWVEDHGPEQSVANIARIAIQNLS